jgi:hypothetical protein
VIQGGGMRLKRKSIQNQDSISGQFTLTSQQLGFGHEDSLMQEFDSVDNSQVRIPAQLFDKSISDTMNVWASHRSGSIRNQIEKDDKYRPLSNGDTTKYVEDDEPNN